MFLNIPTLFIKIRCPFMYVKKTGGYITFFFFTIFSTVHSEEWGLLARDASLRCLMVVEGRLGPSWRWQNDSHTPGPHSSLESRDTSSSGNAGTSYKSLQLPPTWLYMWSWKLKQNTGIQGHLRFK